MHSDKGNYCSGTLQQRPEQDAGRRPALSAISKGPSSFVGLAQRAADWLSIPPWYAACIFLCYAAKHPESAMYMRSPVSISFHSALDVPSDEGVLKKRNAPGYK
jgi:hypothetical protein